MSQAPNDLAHYGVKGMKWGVRKKSPAPTGAEIRAARRNTDNRVSRVMDLAKRGEFADKKTRKAIEAEIQKLGKEGLSSNDASTGARLTRGEKASHIILAGPMAALTIPAASSGVKGLGKYADSVLEDASKFTFDELDRAKAAG